MYELNEWNAKEKFSLEKVAQDIINTPKKSSSNIKTSCCIDTTKITHGPCGSDIQTSCCIDTTKSKISNLTH